MWKTLSNIPLEEISDNVNFLRFRPVGEKILITNMVGDFYMLQEPDFERLLRGQIEEDTDLYRELTERRFIKTEETVEALKLSYRKLFQPKLQGPILHIMVVTKRCNHQCIYCHAAATIDQDMKYQMTEDIARKTIDTIFQSKAPAITLEFQGGEPLENWPIVKYSVEYARQKEEETGKKLYIQIVSNFTLMTEEKMNFLIERGVLFCTSLDGPRDVHNRNRVFLGGQDRAHDLVTKWIDTINATVPSEHQKVHTVISTTTKFTLQDPKAFVDFFIEQGLGGVFIRPLNPMGFATRVWKLIGYSMDEFLDFYFQMIDYILEKNKEGIVFVDKLSQIMLTKILSDIEPNYVDLRSPCGAGVGQVAYNYTGDVYTCDDARWLDEDTFKMGEVGTNTLSEMLQTDVVANMVNASTNEGLYCDNCTYQPYCGICPVYNYAGTGNIVKDLPNSDKCKLHKSLFDYLFKKLQDPETADIFRSWVFLEENTDMMTSLDVACSSLAN